MTTEEKLNAIVAKCRAFLEEKAAKRTPGKWEVDQSTTWDQSRGIHPQIVQRNAYLTAVDAAFIAACAGQAEAMARSTIAAIQDILDYPELHGGTLMEVAILAAWPEELL